MSNDTSREILQPMVDLFGAADGGVAFATLRHQILPEAIAEGKYPEAVRAFLTVSQICKNILELR